MEKISKMRRYSLWIFLLSFTAINLCLIIVIQINNLNTFDVNDWNWENLLNYLGLSRLYVADVGLGFTIPYIDGGTSISRTARYFPTSFIFKPAMFVTSYFLVKYWLLNKEIISEYISDRKIKYFTFFGIFSAICLTLHSLFLGIKIDHDLYKIFRRVILLCFIIFELTAQAYLVICLYKVKNQIIHKINTIFLKLKICLVSILFITAIVSAPIVSMPGNKFLKHALEWDYFLGVILFYLLTFFLWKKSNS